jgi:hypothetical protein
MWFFGSTAMADEYASTASAYLHCRKHSLPCSLKNAAEDMIPFSKIPGALRRYLLCGDTRQQNGHTGGRHRGCATMSAADSDEDDVAMPPPKFQARTYARKRPDATLGLTSPGNGRGCACG